MNRLKVIEELMKSKGLKRYLEIGVFDGQTFFKIKSSYKIAVDPGFQFGKKRRIFEILKNPWNLFPKYFDKTSDKFFEENAKTLFGEKKIQLVLVDGLHEYHQAYQDVIYSLNYLSDDGVILMHDCNPGTKEASVSYYEWKNSGSKGSWNGDVWKAVVRLRSQREDVNLFVLDTDQGLGIITKKKPEKMLSFKLDEIDRLKYEDLEKNRREYLNLKSIDYFFEYFKIS